MAELRMLKAWRERAARSALRQVGDRDADEFGRVVAEPPFDRDDAVHLADELSVLGDEALLREIRPLLARALFPGGQLVALAGLALPLDQLLGEVVHRH